MRPGVQAEHSAFCPVLAARRSGGALAIPERGTIIQTGSGLFLCLLARVPGGSPTLSADLSSPADGQSALRHILCNAGAGADEGLVADGNRRDQGGIAAHEGVFANVRGIFVDAVVVAGNDAGADVGSLADHGIAEVGEVAGLGRLCLSWPS
jgi:hypothetical protein